MCLGSDAGEDGSLLWHSLAESQLTFGGKGGGRGDPAWSVCVPSILPLLRCQQHETLGLPNFCEGETKPIKWTIKNIESWCLTIGCLFDFRLWSPSVVATGQCAVCVLICQRLATLCRSCPNKAAFRDFHVQFSDLIIGCFFLVWGQTLRVFTLRYLFYTDAF